MTLHVVRTDVLLWTLGGFAETDEAALFRVNGLSPVYVRGLKAIASKPRAAYGEVLDYTRRNGQSRQVASKYIHAFRHNKAYRCWSDVA